MKINAQINQVVNQLQAALVAGIAVVANGLIYRSTRDHYWHSAKCDSCRCSKPGSSMSWLFGRLFMSGGLEPATIETPSKPTTQTGPGTNFRTKFLTF